MIELVVRLGLAVFVLLRPTSFWMPAVGLTAVLLTWHWWTARRYDPSRRTEKQAEDYAAG